MNKHEKMNYVEFPANNLMATKTFFENTFGWAFEDFGSEYTSFNNETLGGGFFKAKEASKQVNGGALIVFFSENIEKTQAKIEACGGVITQKTFEFPGGKRFHFEEPSGNEFAVWGEL